MPGDLSPPLSEDSFPGDLSPPLSEDSFPSFHWLLTLTSCREKGSFLCVAGELLALTGKVLLVVSAGKLLQVCVAEPAAPVEPATHLPVVG